MTESLATVCYIGATILFILSLGGLANPETARRGNLFGMIGMALAVIATVLGPRVTPGGYAWIVGALVVGATVGLVAAKKVQMTQMPELVALMHSLVGLAACLVGFASHVDTSTVFATPAEASIHKIEVYVGILIGAVTFSGSIVAFGKLSGKIGGKPLLLPGRHGLNLLGLWLQQEVVQSVVHNTLSRTVVPEQVLGVFGGFVTAARVMAVAMTLAACAMLAWIIRRLMSESVRQEFA